VDALLGIPDMSKLLNESKYKSISRSHLSINQGSLGRIYRYITFYSSAKDILTGKGFHTKSGKVIDLLDNWQINPPKRLLTTRAFYEERFQYSAKLTGIRILHRITLNF
jgi:hypothetical protein